MVRMYGAGLALALGCDFRIMVQEATVCIPEVTRGLFFTWGSTPRLVSIVGAAKAKELIMLAEVVDANEALRIGLVNKVVPKDQLSETVMRLIQKLDSSPFLPIRLTKKLSTRQWRPSLAIFFSMNRNSWNNHYYQKKPKKK